jgi:hypothetical protein
LITKQTIDEICRRLGEDQTLSKEQAALVEQTLRRMVNDDAVKQLRLICDDDSPRTLSRLDYDICPDGSVSEQTAKSFERFWTAVKKAGWAPLGRHAAFKAWEKVPKKDREKAIEQAAVQGPMIAQRARDQNVNLHPSSWLNQKRFLDEPDALRVYAQGNKPNKYATCVRS